ncbi:MAG: 4-hydroxy-tetrahydrodipicolinate synthase [Prolixibacteraceae bacterium]|jgi:4-hydroxy-tetrahydrodipicolinate synthase|nr:4-hydroxy-tetrahydrodipicolinate synthase [Prolixibacteraceae bacterium]NLX29933.1 4-hydroxy-tetrahydrodipicolinate synthase [Bacteroidales bacterium]HNQ37718.1 4-hydroxy-tetrahydrodipicolinate synthase [Prolixibacteraceae bacterium]HOY52467.1 4-hydroxy-tetrahydrodipicolinate synthase [Prolixibacteraceae bacterium]HPJ77843.1 4-hydroxy-tetrahydrodipicolinate synthase [Prolixibacteraceae bacterium]
MKTNFDFTGAGVALVTPFKEDFTIDEKALGAIVERQIAGGMDFLVALGTTAETSTLTEEEKREVVSLVLAQAGGRVPVVVGMGGNDTAAMIRKMEHFDPTGVSAFLVVTPFYNKPNQEGLFRHYRELARHSPLPLILYNVPTRTGVNLEAETVVRLAEASENIVAIKEASGILSQITRIIRYTPPRFKLISGDDVLALPILSIGGEGIISVIANALPHKVSALIHHALAGRYLEARQLHFELIELFRLQFDDGNPAGVKTMLHHFGMSANVLRLPLVPANPVVAAKIVAELQKLN